jgi:hypothetical protein
MLHREFTVLVRLDLKVADLCSTEHDFNKSIENLIYICKTIYVPRYYLIYSFNLHTFS